MKIIGMDVLDRGVCCFSFLFFQKECAIIPTFMEIYTVLVIVIAVYLSNMLYQQVCNTVQKMLM